MRSGDMSLKNESLAEHNGQVNTPPGPASDARQKDRDWGTRSSLTEDPRFFSSLGEMRSEKKNISPKMKEKRNKDKEMSMIKYHHGLVCIGINVSVGIN